MPAGRYSVVAEPGSPSGIALTAAVMHLVGEAREHKRFEKQHRRRAKECWQAVDDIRWRAHAAGITITVEGEAEEEPHGPTRHLNPSAGTRR